MDNKHIITTLIDNGFSKKESLVYITSLQLGSAPISSIARNMGENRVTIYATMKNLINKGVALSTVKNKVTYYSVISPQQVIQKITDKLEQFSSITPDLMALASKLGAPVKTQFYEGIEGLKTAYKQIILTGDIMPPGEAFLTFIGTNDMDPDFEQRLKKDFIPRRLAFPRKTRAILGAANDSYTQYNHSKHETIFIKHPLFNFTNEIVIYGNDQVAIMMYASQEMSALLIQSKTLHDALKAIFEFTRETQNPTNTTKTQKNKQKLQKKR